MAETQWYREGDPLAEKEEAAKPEEKAQEPTRRPKKAVVNTEDRLRRALKNMLDNTPYDATPRAVRQQAEDALKE